MLLFLEHSNSLNVVKYLAYMEAQGRNQDFAKEGGLKMKIFMTSF